MLHLFFQLFIYGLVFLFKHRKLQKRSVVSFTTTAIVDNIKICIYIYKDGTIISIIIFYWSFLLRRLKEAMWVKNYRLQENVCICFMFMFVCVCEPVCAFMCVCVCAWVWVGGNGLERVQIDCFQTDPAEGIDLPRAAMKSTKNYLHVCQNINGKQA